MEIRRLLVIKDVVYSEAGKKAPRPITRAIALAVIHNPFAGRHVEDLSPLVEYVSLVSQHCGVPVPANYPALGEDAFRTGTGVHASAVVKALRRGDRSLADRVYSGVPASVVGREQRIEVGPMSGESNILYWLEQRGIATDRARIDRIMTAAKASDRLLTDEELHALARLD